MLVRNPDSCHTRANLNFINKYGGQRGEFSCLCFVLEIWIKIAVFRCLPVLGWWIKMARIFLSVQVWERSKFPTHHLIVSILCNCEEMFRSKKKLADLLG